MKHNKEKLIIGAAIGNCVHVAGVANFLRLAEFAGFNTKLLGAATPVESIVQTVHDFSPFAVGVSYRLTPTNGKVLIESLLEQILLYPDLILLFGGTPEMVRIVEATGRFSACFIGDEPYRKLEETFCMLRGDSPLQPRLYSESSSAPVGYRVNSLIPAGSNKYMMPLIRHHFGLPDLKKTVKGIRKIAEAEVLDVISIAPDQNAQELFFRPEEMNPSLNGAGGVPLRRPSDLRLLSEASRGGNHPYLRIYSGTQDLLKWAEMSVRELHNAWGTIPLTWYSQLDGRSKRKLEDAIMENMEVITWYAQRNMPVEVNEAHQWSLRDAPDTVSIVMAYIAAYCAKKLGVNQFFAQYMFNTPNFTSSVSDLAKMVAKLTLIETLRDNNFTPYRQVRAGLSHFSVDLYKAKGQLAMSTLIMLNLHPHILHVVGFAEADHASTARDVIESCKIVQGVIRNAFLGMPNLLKDDGVLSQVERLLDESLVLLGTLERFGKALGSKDPLSDPKVIASAIRTGLIDAPHLSGQECALGEVRTAPIDGACCTVDAKGKLLSEADRLLIILRDGPASNLIEGNGTRLIGPPDSFPKSFLANPFEDVH